MKTRALTGNHRSKTRLIITLSLLIAAPLSSGACVTPKVMGYAKIKASPSNITEFTIGKVHSASVLKNGDLSVVAELNNPNNPKSGLYAMTVPLASLTENSEAIGSFGFRTEYISSLSGLTSYLYPMGKAKKFSGDPVQMKDSSNSAIPIQELNVHRDETERLNQLLADLNRDPPGEGKVYSVNLLSNDAGGTLEEEPAKTTEEPATIEESILLLTLTPSSSNSPPRRIAIAGAYEDESTNLYYLLVPPAIASDSILMAFAILAQGGYGY